MYDVISNPSMCCKWNDRYERTCSTLWASLIRSTKSRSDMRYPVASSHFCHPRYVSFRSKCTVNGTSSANHVYILNAFYHTTAPCHAHCAYSVIFRRCHIVLRLLGPVAEKNYKGFKHEWCDVDRFLGSLHAPLRFLGSLYASLRCQMLRGIEYD